MAEARIMIIEDEAIIAKDMENILLNYGFNIIGVYSKAEDAILSLKSEKPDVILMDVVLKGELDGIEAAKIIKKTLSVPIIFITAYADETTINRIKSVNAYGYFLKPFEEKELQTWIETTLVKFKFEEELKRNERMAISIINNLDEAFVSIDENGKVELMNESAEKLVGAKLKDAIGKSFDGLIRSPGLMAEINSFQNNRTPFKIVSGKTEIKDPSDKSISVSYKIIPNYSGNALQGLSILFKDFDAELRDELNELAMKLNESNRELEKFAYIASHDLQEPLRMVASYVQLLRKRYQGRLDEQADEYINYAVDSANRMRKLIDDLLLYSRISSRKIKPEEVDCNEIISAIIPDICRSYGLDDHVIKFSKLPVIKADKFQIRQLFGHLIENSVKFNEQKEPLVEISCQKQENKLIFSIADNGIGIEKQYIEKIFEAFHKLHHHKEYPGSGIGLTLCKKIIEMHGGRIFVESKPKEGTVIRFELPINLEIDGRDIAD